MKRCGSIEWNCAVLEELASELGHNVFIVKQFCEALTEGDKEQLDLALEQIRQLNGTVRILSEKLLTFKPPAATPAP